MSISTIRREENGPIAHHLSISNRNKWAHSQTFHCIVVKIKESCELSPDSGNSVNGLPIGIEPSELLLADSGMFITTHKPWKLAVDTTPRTVGELDQ